MSCSPALVGVHRLPSEVDARVREACLRAGARTVPSDAFAHERPALIVAHLPRGARRIPPDVVEVAHRTDGELPLILTCDEKLVHPSTTLCLGGVTLVEHAATERLYSQIRIALAATQAHVTEPLEHAGPHWWLGSIGAGDAVAVACDEALSALVRLEKSADRVAKVAKGHAIATSESDDIGSSLVECLGHDVGFVHLTREARSLILYWPAGLGGLWLYSSYRLPHLSELSRVSDVPRILQSPAAPGEIILATTRPLDASQSSIVQGLADGGPATLDRLRASALAVDGFVVEVR